MSGRQAHGCASARKRSSLCARLCEWYPSQILGTGTREAGVLARPAMRPTALTAVPNARIVQSAFACVKLSGINDFFGSGLIGA
eukprot:2894110-Rhodomonas_salina.1